MFFAATAPALGYRQGYAPTGRSLERFLNQAVQTGRNVGVEQDDKSVTLTFDVPGITREQLSIGIEGNVVRLQTKEDAKRQYKAAYELAADIDAATSEAKLENGVLTLKLAKVVPVSKVTELTIN
ncbi:MAG: Hsp20/alpha crystallin family protein [Burkholderiaceae bacterium]